jgi:predicted ATPase with chaperone activity
VKRLSIKDHQPNQGAIAQLLVQMGMEEQLVMQGHHQHQFIYYQPSFYYSEQNIAARLHQLLAHPVTVDLPRVRNWIERFTQAKGIELSPQQQQAVEMAASQRVLILTGGPGTGKTFCTRTIVALWKAMGKSIALASRGLSSNGTETHVKAVTPTESAFWKTPFSLNETYQLVFSFSHSFSLSPSMTQLLAVSTEEFLC